MSRFLVQPEEKKPPLQRIVEMISEFDGRSWAILLLFFAVLTVAALLNAFAMSAFFVPWLAYSLSGFMEIGTLVWKIADERKQNSDAQKQLTSIIVWANVVMFSILLLANLIRVALRAAGIVEDTGTAMTTWDYLAFGLISMSALGHVIGPLLFREWDIGLQNRRILAQQRVGVQFETEFHKGVLQSVDERLRARNLVYQRLQQIRQQYANSDIPAAEIEALLAEAKEALEIKHDIDFDGDGFIGPPAPPQKPPAPPQRPPQPPKPPFEVMAEENQDEYPSP